MYIKAYIFVLSKKVDNSAFSDIGSFHDQWLLPWLITVVKKILGLSCDIFEDPVHAATLLTKQGEGWKYFFTSQMPP